MDDTITHCWIDINGPIPFQPYKSPRLQSVCQLSPTALTATHFHLIFIIMSLFDKVARTIDYTTATWAPLDTNGARPEPHTAENRLLRLRQLFRKPALSPMDVIRTLRGACGEGINDRDMMLEDLLVDMASHKDLSASLKVQQTVINFLYKDLPHPPCGFLTPLDVNKAPYPPPQVTQGDGPKMPAQVHYAYRAADGSNYNSLIPGIGKAGSPYARSVPATNLTPVTTLPDPHLVFDTLLKRDKFTPHPDGISSLFFAFADLVIHSIFNTNSTDWSINDSSSYLDLSVLYGSSEDQLKTVRAFDGMGKLKPDCFADKRLLMMPPASCALLVLLNRNHNYIAEKLFDINEFQRYKDPARLPEDEKEIQDNEIFHRTRLVNCGYFMHIVLGDYVGAILGLVRDANSWRLDPLMDFREMNHDISARGEGNVVSVEFNLLYRWHSTLSEENTEWLEREFGRLFPPKDAGDNDILIFKDNVRKMGMGYSKTEPTEWTFGGKSRVNGRFKDQDLAEILQNATGQVAGAFKARGTPEIMRVVEVLAIRQSRTWGICSLNEFRKFIGLKPYKDFKEWNPDPQIYTAAAALYKDIDRLELHVGLQAEETKKPQPGAGLCPGFTISRAILADAVCLTRGDRFLTTDFTPYNLTAWGYKDCQYDTEDGSYGGLLTKLLFRTLPEHYPAGSALAHFPFHIPQKMFTTFAARKDGSVYKYKWPEFKAGDLPANMKSVLDNVPFLKSLETPSWKVVADLESVKTVLSTRSKSFSSDIGEREAKVVALVSGRKGGDNDDGAMRTRVTEFLASRNGLPEYFKERTEFLLKDKAFDQAGSKGVCYVDIVKDVINMLPIHWICHEIAYLPLKTRNHLQGAWYEQPTFDKFADIAQYVYMNFDPVDDFKLRERSQKGAEEVINTIRSRLDDSDRKFESIATDALEYVKLMRRTDNVNFLKALRGSTKGNTTDLAVGVFNATIPTAPLFSKAVAQVVDYFLEEANIQAKEEISKIFLAGGEGSSAKIMGYIREALRLNPIFAGVYRRAREDIILGQRVTPLDDIFIDIAKANASLGDKVDYARPSGKQGILSPYEDGLLAPKLFEAVAPVVVGTILSKEGLKRAGGESGKLTKFDEEWQHGTKHRQYVNMSGLVTPWPDAMIVTFTGHPERV